MKIVWMLAAALVQPVAAADLSCFYASRAQQTIVQEAACVEQAQGRPVPKAAVLSDMAFEGGLGQMFVQGVWYWVRPDGYAQAALAVDNGPDAFAQGVMRGPGRQGITYYGTDLQPVLETPYTWGLSFHEDYALVCADCAAKAPDENGYRSIEGETWGVIDRQGKVRVPPTLTRQEAVSQLDTLMSRP